jgi:LacI family transcriptional regulator
MCCRCDGGLFLDGRKGWPVSITSHDVAKLAGVSRPTVSRALRPDSQVSEATRRRVRDGAEQLGYVPS